MREEGREGGRDNKDIPGRLELLQDNPIRRGFFHTKLFDGISDGLSIRIFRTLFQKPGELQEEREGGREGEGVGE